MALRFCKCSSSQTQDADFSSPEKTSSFAIWDIWQRLATFLIITTLGEGVVLACSGQRPGRLVSVPRRPGQPQNEDHLAPNVKKY